MDKLQQILNRCKSSVHLTVNNHRGYYKTIDSALDDIDDSPCPPKITDDIRKGMRKTNTIIELQFYPDTPRGSYIIYHYDLEKTLDRAIEILKERDLVHG